MRFLFTIMMFFSFDLYAKELVVAVNNFSYEPRNGIGEKGEYTGLSQEMWAKFARDKGYDLVLKPMPIQDQYEALVEQRVEFKFPDNPVWNKNAKKGVQVHYTNPIFSFVEGMLVEQKLKGMLFENGNIPVFAVIKGFSLPRSYLNMEKEGKIVIREVFDLDELVDLALSHEVDGIYANLDILAYKILGSLGNLRSSYLVLDRSLPYRKSAYYASSAKSPRMVEEFNVWLEENERYIKALKARYNYRELIEFTD